MDGGASVFEKHYRFYRERIGRLPLAETADAIGAAMDGDALVVPFFGRPYRIGPVGVTDPSGRRPSYDVCVILSRYLLCRPASPAEDRRWKSFRVFSSRGSCASRARQANSEARSAGSMSSRSSTVSTIRHSR